VRFDEPMQRLFNQGMILGPDGEKMSKSRGNVINPEAVVDQYGADTVRGYMMFLGPWDQGGPWNPKGIEGVSRFLQRVFGLVVDKIDGDLLGQSGSTDAVEQAFHQTIIHVTEGIAGFRFNTAIANLMELSNLLLKAKLTSISTLPIWNDMLNTFITLMAPLFPYISEELWHRMGHTESVHLQKWPQADVSKAEGDRVTMVVQVNSRVRSEIRMPRGVPSEMIKKNALEMPEIQKWIAGKTIQKIVVVENRLVNIVVV
jgi:leucyl-tRNA synthetase